MCTQPDTGHGTGQPVEVADILRTYGTAYQQRHRLSGGQRRVMQDIMACRTAVLGGQLAQCDHCSAQVIRYHSCQNRHCPKCQTLAKVRWVEARLRDLLPIPYFHCVFTLPHTLNPLAHGNPRVLYGLLFQTAAATLQTFGRDSRWLGGELGITMSGSTSCCRRCSRRCAPSVMPPPALSRPSLSGSASRRLTRQPWSSRWRRSPPLWRPSQPPRRPPPFCP
jgi:hypothetical protein